MNFFKKIFGVRDIKKDTNQIEMQPDKEMQSAKEIEFDKSGDDVIKMGDLLIQYVTIHGKDIMISGKISQQNLSIIEYKSFRPKEFLSTLGQTLFLTSTYEFFIDFKNFYRYISKESKIDEKSFINSFLKVVSSHIEKHDRITDTDLFTYIDYAVGIKQSLWSSFFNQKITTENLPVLWLELKELSFKKFRENIYISKYDFSSPLNPTVTLVKLTDL